LAVEAQRVVGRRGVLHVDPDEVAELGGVPDDVLEVRLAEVVAELQAEPRRLHAHVRAQLAALERVERLAVGRRDRARLAGARDLLAEHVDGGELPLVVQPPHDDEGVVELLAGDVALRDLPHHRLRHRRQEADDRGIDEAHRLAGFYERVLCTSAVTRPASATRSPCSAIAPTSSAAPPAAPAPPSATRCRRARSRSSGALAATRSAETALTTTRSGRSESAAEASVSSGVSMPR